MAYRMIDGFEVDEQGYLRTAVEAWAKHGIYPPPLCGDATPENVARVKQSRARVAAMTEEERQQLRQRHAEFLRRWDNEHPEFAAQLAERSRTS